MVSPDIPNIIKPKNGDVSAHERTRLLLDTTPIACRLMKRVNDEEYELFECNEESAKLFKFKDKQEFMERYFEIFPELQPDGRNSMTEAQRLINEAFNKGRCVTEFMFQTADGEPVPSEVTLVRLEYGDDYIIAGYTRDMREHVQMMETIEKRDSLLNTINRVAGVLLAAANEENPDDSLIKGMELIGRYFEADSVQVWRNEMIEDRLHFVLNYKWLSGIGKRTSPMDVGTAVPYSASWKDLFLRGECINGPVESLSREDRNTLSPLGITSTITIPLFYREKFWGLFCVDDYIKERYYSEGEVGILHSAALMLVNAINRNMQAAQILEAHSRTQLLLDTTPLAVHLWDRNLNLFDCNEESVRLFNRKDKQDYLEHFGDLSPEYQPDGSRSSEVAMQVIKQAFQEGKHVFEWMHRSSDGILIPSEVTLVRVAYEDDFAVAGYVRDLREQKEMMKEIQQKTSLLDSVNRAATILLQSEIDEFENNLQICMGMIGEAANADRMCIWKNSVKEGKLHCTLAYEWIANERLRTSRDISTDVPYEGNIPTFERLLTQGVCINSRTCDLSPEEQKRMSMHEVKSIFVAPVFVHDEFWGFVGCDNCREESVFSEEVATTLRSGSLLIANALLRNEMTLNLKLAAVELEAALMETQKANNAKSDFLANMSHEMRTPLNAIIGLTWLSLENEKLDNETQANLEKTHNAGTTLLGIVNDILDISKIESGKLELVPIEYNVASLINDTVTQNLLRIGEKPIELKLDVDKDMYAYLYGDELRLKQIMNNLLSNAIKYTAGGEVELTVSSVRKGDVVWLTIKVRDTGQGIKKEDVSRLFDDYSQLDTKSNRKIEGTGLGLSITKRLCELMGGSIVVESEYGKGSVFTVRLKQAFVTGSVIGPEVVASLNSFRFSDGRRNKNMEQKRISLPYAHVLVVDDNQTNLDVARGLMKPYGMRVCCVDSGQKAIDAISAGKDRFDAVFMDQMMPGMDGIEATRHIRELPSDYAKNIPVVALTANAVAGNEEMFLSKGFQAFLSKPIDIARLDAVIRQWIRDPEKEQLLADADSHEENSGKTGSFLLDKEVAGMDVRNGVTRYNGDEEVYANILHTYSVNTRNLLASIEIVTRDKIKSYEITVHSIKGSSFGICADYVGRLAADLENAAKTGDLKYIGMHNRSFIEAAGKLVSDIENLLASRNADNPKPKRDKPDGVVLSKLLTACDAYDMDEVDAAMEELTGYLYESDDGLVDWLHENVDLMNFTEIVEKLSGL